jgi:hypothetical protein
MAARSFPWFFPLTVVGAVEGVVQVVDLSMPSMAQVLAPNVRFQSLHDKCTRGSHVRP